MILFTEDQMQNMAIELNSIRINPCIVKILLDFDL